MTEPRTIAGRAALSAMRPHVKRALGRTIARIESEAIAPYLDALREADHVLEELAADDGTTGDPASPAELVKRAAAARQLAKPLLAPPSMDEPG